jgi:hypothetical protein
LHYSKSKELFDYKDIKCSLYDALLYYNVISKEIYDNLAKDYKKLGPIWKVNWNINGLTLDSIKTKYAILDVFYLLDLYQNIKKEIDKVNITNLSLKRFINITKYVILKRNKIEIINNEINNLELENLDAIGKLLIADITYFRNILTI